MIFEPPDLEYTSPSTRYTRCHHFLRNHGNCIDKPQKQLRKSTNSLHIWSKIDNFSSRGVSRRPSRGVSSRLVSSWSVSSRLGAARADFFLPTLFFFVFWGGLGDRSGLQKTVLGHPERRLGRLLGVIFVSGRLAAIVSRRLVSSRLVLERLVSSRGASGPRVYTVFYDV